MNDELPELNPEEIEATKNYLEDICKILSELQLAMTSEEDATANLEITMRGIATQTLNINSKPTRALLDLVRHKLRLGDDNWTLREHSPGELLKISEDWLRSQKLSTDIHEPDMHSGEVVYDTEQADNLINVFWWMVRQLQNVETDIELGQLSPITLKPQDLDLSLSWLSEDDEHHIDFGFNLGDRTIAEPYVYLTLFQNDQIISGVTITYDELRKQEDPELAIEKYIDAFVNLSQQF